MCWSKKVGVKERKGEAIRGVTYARVINCPITDGWEVGAWLRMEVGRRNKIKIMVRSRKFTLPRQGASSSNVLSSRS